MAVLSAARVSEPTEERTNERVAQSYAEPQAMELARWGCRERWGAEDTPIPSIRARSCSDRGLAH